MGKLKKELLYHLHIRNVSKGKGHKLGQKLSYIRGTKITDQHTGEIFNNEPKGVNEGIRTILLIPEGANKELQDLDVYTNQMFKKEHAVNAQLYREMEVSLFKDLPKEWNEEIILRFGRKLQKEEGMFVEINLHKEGTDRPHAHMALNYRTIDKNGNLGNKNREWNDRGNARKWRKWWAETANEYFKEKGLDYEISELSYAERGIDKIAQKKLPMDKRSEQYREIQEINESIKKYNTRKELEADAKAIKRVKQIHKNDIAKVKFLREGGVIMEKEQDETKERIKQNIQSEINKDEALRVERNQNVSYFEEKWQNEEIERNQLGDGMNHAADILRQAYLKQVDTAVKHKQDMDNHNQNLIDKKRVALSEKNSFKNKKDRYATKTNSLKRRNKQLRLDNKELKIEMKSTSLLSIEGYKKRKALKLKMKKNKILIKKNKLEMSKERYAIRQEAKAYKATKREVYKTAIESLKSGVKAKMMEIKAIRTHVAQQQAEKKGVSQNYDNVVSLKDFKQQKIKIELDKESVKAIGKAQDQKQQRSMAR